MCIATHDRRDVIVLSFLFSFLDEKPDFILRMSVTFRIQTVD